MTSQKLTPFSLNGVPQSNFYYDPVSGILYFKKGHAGRKIKFSTGFKIKDFNKAKVFANKKLTELLGTKKVVVRNLIKDELKLWLLVKESEDLAYDTMNNIRRAAGQIEEFWGNQFPSDIGKDNLVVWYDWWKQNKTGDMENAIKYMRNFCRYLAQKIVNNAPLIPVMPEIHDPGYKKIRQRRKKAKEKTLSHQDLKIILSTAPSLRDKVIILIMYTMASRITETCEMSLGSELLKQKGKWIYRWSVGQNKADLEGWHYLHDSAVKPLEKYLESIEAADGDRIFPQANDQTKAIREQMIDWDAWRKRAKVGFHWTPHTFRHTCLTNLFSDPKNPQGLICKLYRVSLAVAMETYIHPDDEGKKKMAKSIKVGL